MILLASQLENPAKKYKFCLPVPVQMTQAGDDETENINHGGYDFLKNW